MKAKGLRYLLITLLAVLTAFSVIGCGSGGGGGGSTPAAQSATVSGVAATGAAMSGNVSLKDSSNPVKTLGPVPINPDGSFTFNVTGLTPPFYLCATDNGGNKLYSVAMDDGLANINPATNIVFANLSGNDPAAFYNDPFAHPIDQNSLDQALNNLRTFMSDLLSDYGVSNVNPLTDPFIANGTGLDGLFDDVQVEISGGMVTLYDGLHNQLGQVHVDNLQNVTDPVDHAGSTPLMITVSGDGYIFATQSSPAAYMWLNIDESSLSASSLTYMYRGTFFTSSSITQVTARSGQVTIKGTCTISGTGYNFTATVSTNQMGMQIVDAGGSVHQDSANLQTLDGGIGFTISIQ